MSQTVGLLVAGIAGAMIAGIAQVIVAVVRNKSPSELAVLVGALHKEIGRLEMRIKFYEQEIEQLRNDLFNAHKLRRKSDLTGTRHA